MGKIENILVVRLKSIGDVILLLPAVSALRQQFPSARITFLTSAENAALLAGFRDVDQVLTIDRKALRSGNPFRIIPEFLGLIRKMRAGHFDLAVDFQGYGETAWLVRLTGAAERWGGVYSSGRRWAYTRNLTRLGDIHPAAGHLELLRQGGVKTDGFKNKYVPPANALAAADKFLADNRLDTARPILYLQPFTSSPHKNWPLESYLAVARHFRDQGVQIVFCGGPDVIAQLEPARQDGFVVAAGLSPLTVTGLLQRSTLALGGDTGFLHLAVALQRPVVMLMPYVRPGSPVPFQHEDWALRPPDNRGSIADIPVAEVITACTAALKPATGNH